MAMKAKKAKTEEIEGLSDGEEFDDEELEEELNLPKSLVDLTRSEKIELLRFKREHNEREWEEEISRRAASFERKLDYERLKRMTGVLSNAAQTNKEPRRGKRSGDKSSERGDEDKEEEDDEFDEDEEEMDDGFVADTVDDYNPQPQSDDDLFDSDEEAEISKRPTKQFDDDDEADSNEEGEILKKEKTPKVLGKRRAKSQGRRKSNRLAKYSGSSDEEEEEEDYLREGSDGDEEEGNEADQHDYNLKSIKDSHRRNLNKDGMPQSSSSGGNQAEKTSIVFDNLSQLKAHFEKQLQKDLPYKPDDNEVVDEQDFRKLFRRRDDIVRNLHEPFFDQLVIGCYVRYLIGVDTETGKQVYRMCEIIGVDHTKRPYKLPPLANGLIIETSVRLHLNNAGEIKQSQKLEKVSNHSLKEDEITYHINGMKTHPEKVLPTKRDFRKLRQRHRQYAEHTYTHEDISHMVSNKMGLNKLLTTEYSTAMNLLKKRLEDATQKNEKDKIEALRKEVKRLEEINEKQKESFEAHGKKQSDINRRMRESNVTRDMDAGMRKRHEEQEAIAKGVLPNAISDPFIRRETRPKILWNTSENLKKKKQDEKSRDQQPKEGGKLAADVGPSIKGKKTRGGQEDRWAISTELSLTEVQKRVRQRLGVDPVQSASIGKRERYLRKVCANLPPVGSLERERLRGRNKSLKDYIALLGGDTIAEEDNKGVV